MVKFVKDFFKERKKKVIDYAASQTFMSFEKQYKVFVKGLNGFISGKPNKSEQLAFSTLWKFPGYGIDTKYNKDARKRCKLISKRYRKDKVVLSEDKLFLQREVMPYVIGSFEDQTGQVFETLGGISEGEAKEAYLLYSKNKRAMGRLLK